MKRWKDRAVMLTVLAMLVGCTTAQPPEEKPVQEGSSPPSLVPQAEGTPLPPRDPRIAERWPPEIKQLVDNMLTLNLKSPSERPPTVKEVEKKMGITLTEQPQTEGDAIFRTRRFAISGTRYMDPSLQQFGLGEHYTIRRGRSPGDVTQDLSLITSPKQTGFCLDPYELAVYTGSTFVNGDAPAHVSIREWAPAYVWGMFRWSDSGLYVGRGFSISVGQDRDPNSREIVSTGCVGAITVFGRYQEEEILGRAGAVGLRTSQALHRPSRTTDAPTEQSFMPRIRIPPMSPFILDKAAAFPVFA
jgi:hypothetical protein